MNRRPSIKLRIVSWNCNMALRPKFDRLLALQPDVAVVQECARSADAGARGWRPDCSDYDWIGSNANKGLGVFTFGAWRVQRHASYSEAFALYLPVEVSGPCRFNLLGTWVAGNRTMPTAATNDPAAAIGFYTPFLTAAPSVVAGDFNRLPQQMSSRPAATGKSVTDLLAQAGLSNADYLMSDAAGQAALVRTHFHQRHLARGFVVDYIFVPTGAAASAPRLSAFAVGAPRDWIRWSDHMPLVAEFDVADGSSSAM